MDQAQHQNLAAGRWFEMTLPQQLGNVGSEFERALKWKQKGQSQLFESATARMLELLDLTIADPRWHGYRLRELTRLREFVCEELYGRADSDAAMGLKKYFLQFALLARS